MPIWSSLCSNCHSFQPTLHQTLATSSLFLRNVVEIAAQSALWRCTASSWNVVGFGPDGNRWSSSFTMHKSTTKQHHMYSLSCTTMVRWQLGFHAHAICIIWLQIPVNACETLVAGIQDMILCQYHIALLFSVNSIPNNHRFAQGPLWT